MASHLFHFENLVAQKQTPYGARVDADHKIFPALKGLSVSMLTLEKKGVREPHWHPNAHELGFCVQGKALMTLFGPGNTHDTLLLEAGDIAFVPQGVLHHVSNVGKEKLKMVLGFNDASPEDLNLSSSVGSMAPHVLGATFSKDGSFFKPFKLSQEPAFIIESAPPEEWDLNWMTNRYKYGLERSSPQVATRGGYVRMSNGFLFPCLKGIALYTLVLERKGVREPHWHPNAGELNVLLEGHARITLVSPGGRVETFNMHANDISYMPQGYIHHIENIGTLSARFLIFFNHEYPSDIGLTGCLGAYSSQLVSDLFKVPKEYLTSLPKYQVDLLIVGGG